MSLKPRYSLLTLLILTALVAGGVKLWYGPHHVVEWPDEDHELEYTFTRDWRGNKTIDGPVFLRNYQQGFLKGFKLHYFQQGRDSTWIYQTDVKKVAGQLEPVLENDPNCPLSESERVSFYRARNAELQRIEAAGFSYDYDQQFEGRYKFKFELPLKP